jgi:hypothetical protein
MSSVFFCDNEGRRRLVQLSPDEYDGLLDEVRNDDFRRIALKRVFLLLSDSEASGAASEKAAPQGSSGEDIPDSVQLVDEPSPARAAEIEKSPEAPPPLPQNEPAVIEKSNNRLPSGAAVAIPPVLLNFIEAQKQGSECKAMIEDVARRLSDLCGRRITLSLHKPYICFWDFDAWQTFAFGEIRDGGFHLSMEQALLPEDFSGEEWIPPAGLCKKPLIRFSVPEISDGLLVCLQRAISGLS